MSGSPAGPAGSYPDAYAKVFAKDSNRPVSRGSYAEAHARKQSPSPAKRQEYYSPTSKKSGSILNRPIKPSQRHVENLDIQYAKDKDAFDRRANIYRSKAGERCHHHRPPESIITLWESGHIVDRGRGTAHVPPPYNPVHPDSRMFDSITTKGTERSQSVPHQRPTVRPATAHTSSVRAQMGTYDPIRHVYITPPDPGYEAVKEKQFNRIVGQGATGLGIRVDPMRASFDPITGQNRPEMAAAASARRPVSAPRASRPDGSVTRQTAGTAASAAMTNRSTGAGSAAGAGALPAERSATPGRRSCIHNGSSWGTYNPLLHDWVVPPQDAKYRDQNQVSDQRHGITGSHVRKAEPSRNQGIYNPILNTWVVPPANPKMVAGLAFAPAALFRASVPRP